MKNILEKVISRIADLGAEGDLILSKSQSLKLSAQNKELSKFEVSSSQILGVRVVKDSKVGISYTESLDEESIVNLVHSAVQNAQFSDTNPYETISSQSGELNDLIVPIKEETSIDDKIKLTIELEDLPKKLDSRVKAVPYNGYSENFYESYYLSSSGRYTSYNNVSYNIWCSVLLEEGQKKSTFYDFNPAHSFKDLKVEDVVKKSLLNAQQLLREEILSTGKYNVHFSIDSLQSLFSVFSGVFSAKRAKDNMNPWKEMKGKEVTHKDLTIIDDPLFAESFRISKFDSEGVETSRLKMIENGVLNSFFHNTATAAYFNEKTTGHASRSPAGSLNVSGTNTIISGRNSTQMPDRYLEIIQLDGLHAGTNTITGDFSLPVKGYLCSNGDRVPFGNVTLSGNFFTMLKELLICGNTLQSSRDMSFFSLPLVFTDLSLAGK